MKKILYTLAAISILSLQSCNKEVDSNKQTQPPVIETLSSYSLDRNWHMELNSTEDALMQVYALDSLGNTSIDTNIIISAGSIFDFPINDDCAIIEIEYEYDITDTISSIQYILTEGTTTLFIGSQCPIDESGLPMFIF